MATYYNANKKIWSGPEEKTFFGDNITLGEIALFTLNKADPARVIQIIDNNNGSCERVTAGTLLYECKLIAKNLIKFGVNIGDVIGFSGNHSKHMLSVIIATFLCGAPKNSIHLEFDKDTIKSIFGTTRPKIAFCDIESYDNLKLACDELNLKTEFFLMNGNIDGVRNVNELLIDDGANMDFYSFPCFKLTADDVAVLLCTSGTTGIPSIIQSSHKSLFKNNPNADATYFVLSSTYWLSCLNVILIAVTSLATLVCTRQPFTPLHFLQIIQKYKVTHVGATPNQLARILETKNLDIGKYLTHTRFVFCYGSITPQIVADGINKVLKEKNILDLTIAYGMSEIPNGVAANYCSSTKRTEGNVGKLFTNNDVRIVNENGQNCGINERGIIHVKPKYKLLGYYRNPEANKKAMLADNWFVTSDIGYFNEEGDLHICSRNNDIFKSNNFPIFPHHIEEVIQQLPGVSEVCVFGIPDPVATNLIACAIVRKKTEASEKLTEADVIEKVAKHKAPCYHIKGGVYFIDNLPKTATDKIKRRCIFDAVKSNNYRIKNTL